MPKSNVMQENELAHLKMQITQLKQELAELRSTIMEHNSKIVALETPKRSWKRLWLR